MIPKWVLLSDVEQRAFRTAVAFLQGRLSKRSTVDWALKLDERQATKRMAVLAVLGGPEGRQLKEPYRETWRFIEESWESLQEVHDDSHAIYEARERIRSGERTGALITAIVRLVKPAVKVEPFSKSDAALGRVRKRPRRADQFMVVTLTSGRVVDPDELGLPRVSEPRFLTELGNELDGAVNKGLDIGRRLKWDGVRGLWRLGDLRRAYFVREADRADGEHEPDEFNSGIAPSVKLLHSVVMRLLETDLEAAQTFTDRWRETKTPIHQRLWCAAALDQRAATGRGVGQFLLNIGQRAFWDTNNYPEIAELRSKRFRDLDGETQVPLLARLRRGPPRSLWPGKLDKQRAEHARTAWKLRELKRIQVAGSDLPEDDKAWIRDQEGGLQGVEEMDRVDAGFIGTPKARALEPNPDNRYDELQGLHRLNALENGLTSPRRGWDDDPSERASDWIRKAGSVDLLIADFAKVGPRVSKFPAVLNAFGWAHSPPTEIQPSDLMAKAKQVMPVFRRLSVGAAREAIDGIAHWLSAWERTVVRLPRAASLWLRLWPIAAEVTNAQMSTDREPLGVTGYSLKSEEPQDLDTLNTPAGKLVGVFLRFCPNLKLHPHPFRAPTLKKMRSAIITAGGRAELIGRHRLIEDLSYFQRADPAWTKTNLIGPLLASDARALVLWRAFARRPHSRKVFAILGHEMIRRALDSKLGRRTRESLAFTLIVQILYGYLDGRRSKVPRADVQQMLRSLDDEVRSNAANTVSRFLKDLAPKYPQEVLFQRCAKPFLEDVWPQERSLARPGVARAFAQVPAFSGTAFADAVSAVERFLVPFDCWSLSSYGFYGDKALSTINNREKAEALLRLLEVTIGSSESSVVPTDLGDALQQVTRVAPKLVKSQKFRRLATLARR